MHEVQMNFVILGGISTCPTGKSKYIASRFHSYVALAVADKNSEKLSGILQPWSPRMAWLNWVHFTNCELPLVSCAIEISI